MTCCGSRHGGRGPEHGQVGMSRAFVLSILMATALAVAGCGVRGSLEAPPSAKADTTAQADSGQGKPAGAAPKPHREFVLDGLLR